MGRRKSHTKTTYLVRRDNLPTINFVLRDNERPALGAYLDPQDPSTWRPVDLTGKSLTGWFKEMCVNGKILFGIPVLRHDPFSEGRCTLLGSPSVLMDIPPGWYELEVEMHTCNTSYKQTVWKRFKFCIREDFDTSETDGMNAPIYRDANGNLQELPVNPPDCGVLLPAPIYLPYGSTTHTVTGTASDTDNSVVSIQYRLNGGAWFTATGVTDWTAIITGLVIGENLIDFRSIDIAGACSVISSCLVVVAQNAPPSLSVDCGDNAPDEQPNACFDDIRASEAGEVLTVTGTRIARR